MAGEPDPISPEEAEALVKSSPPGGDPSDAVLGQDEIAELFRQHEVNKSGRGAGRSAEQLVKQAEADLAAALAPTLGGAIPPDLGAAKPFPFQELSQHSRQTDDALELGSLRDVELDLRIELGRTELLIDEVLKLKEGSVVPLDKLAGDPVDILVNGRLIARGAVLVLNDNFCVRVAEILAPSV